MAIAELLIVVAHLIVAIIALRRMETNVFAQPSTINPYAARPPL